jgi:3-oxoacyl-[acyl-carrier-protein] synthase II
MTGLFSQKSKKVVVTGLGMVTSLGIEIEDIWQKMLEGRSGIHRLSSPDAVNSPTQAVGQVQKDDWLKIKNEFPRDARNEGERRSLFALWASKAAIEDAGLNNNIFSNNRCGIALAAGLGINRLEDIQRWTKDGVFDFEGFGKQYRTVHHESLIKNSSDRPSTIIAEKFGLNGVNLTITTACASATQALGIAYRKIRRGEADIMIAGGADSMINPVGLIFFVLLNAADTTSENPETACKPFDRRRAGLVMGEGAGIAILEEESHALMRNAKIYAEVAGYGTTMDAYKVTAPDPSGKGAEASMRSSLLDAKIQSNNIDYINAHGTGTKLNDIAETTAIKNLFKDHAKNISINSTKSMIGHLIAASGGPEFVVTVLTVHNNVIHPTINLTQPDSRCDLDYVPNIKKKKTVRAAISNSFGFGGQNASIVVKKYQGKV